MPCTRLGLLALVLVLPVTAQRWQPESRLPPLPVALHGHSIASLRWGNDIYVAFGGRTANGQVNREAYVFDSLVPSRWSQVNFVNPRPARTDGQLISVPIVQDTNFPYPCTSGGIYYVCPSQDGADLEFWSFPGGAGGPYVEATIPGAGTGIEALYPSLATAPLGCGIRPWTINVHGRPQRVAVTLWRSMSPSWRSQTLPGSALPGERVAYDAAMLLNNRAPNFRTTGSAPVRGGVAVWDHSLGGIGGAVVFSGTDASGQPVDAFFDDVGESWARSQAPTALGARTEAAVFYDRVLGAWLMDGGLDAQGQPVAPGFYRYAEPTTNGSGIAYGAACNPRPAYDPRLATQYPIAIGYPLTIASEGPANVMLVGATMTPTPLAPFGAPGCTLLTSAEVSLPWPTRSMAFAVPVDPRLVGSSLYFQSTTPNGATNALGLVFSRGLQVTFGLR